MLSNVLEVEVSCKDELVQDFYEHTQRIAGLTPEAVNAAKDQLVKYLRTPKERRPASAENINLFKKWYDSLKRNDPDFTVYDDPRYIGDMFACWHVYSSKYIRTTRELLEEMNPPMVVDIGCGPGLSTAELALMLPDARVVGVNIPGTDQYRIAEAMGKKYGFEMVGAVTSINQSGGVLFASEYFEHFEFPGEHLKDVVEEIEPDSMIVANAFGSTSVGHFDQYLFKRKDGREYEEIQNKSAGRRWNSTARDLGYEKVPTGYWNNRPAVWVRTG